MAPARSLSLFSVIAGHAALHHYAFVRPLTRSSSKHFIVHHLPCRPRTIEPEAASNRKLYRILNHEEPNIRWRSVIRLPIIAAAITQRA